jgi:gamma-glutamyltranspeptidase/glutathione hydrolase
MMKSALAPNLPPARTGRASVPGDGRASHAAAADPAALPFSFALPYPSRRVPVLGRQAVAASHALAAQTGLAVLERGGNAIDAALAAAAAQTVVEPTMNGAGSDLFAMIWDGTELHGLNASGRAPAAWSLARFAGRKQMPELGWDAVTVPGAVGGWAALWRRFGSLPFESLLAPAIRYAREGFPVAPGVAALWAEAPARFAGFAELARVFLPGGRAPAAGTWFRLPDLAATLESIAETKGESFYRGALAQRIAQAAADDGGALARDDLAAYEPAWVEPLAVDFRGVRLHELPPNGQGLAALLALGILRALPVAEREPEHPDSVHLQVEAMKLAFAECHKHVGDPARMTATAEALLAPARLARYAARIDPRRAGRARPLPPPDHGTIYVTAADRQGRMVSLIQSNYLGFGSGVVVPGTGITLQNRGLGFSLDPRRTNCVAGGARPYHTIMPGFVTRDGAPLMSFGVMGGHMQPQGHVQLMLRIFAHGQNPQAACDAPRWHVTEQSHVALEPGFPPAVARTLRRRGHTLVDGAPTQLFGGAQVIVKLPDGYCAASDPRKDGQAVGS